jgi:hypothetical protein
MSRRAALRRKVQEAELYRPPERGPADEEAIRREMANVTPRESDAIACACVGPPDGCVLCYCHIHEEARARVEGRACGWCSSAA